MSQQLIPTVSLAGGFRRLGGLAAGLIIVLAVGWGLVYATYTLAGAYHLGVTPFAAALIAAAVSFAAFQYLERDYRLSRLAGFDPGDEPAWLSAVFLWAGGPLWLLYRVNTYGQPSVLAKLASVVAPPPKQAKEKEKKKESGRDSLREGIETLVFVVCMVLMLKLFVVEAFVIPTGSMAETLYGYQKIVTCPECGHVFPVNASREAEPQPGSPPVPITGYCCPNCRYADPTGLVTQDRATGQVVKKVDWRSGDRVLVGKFLGVDDRNHVVVFKFPDAPQTGQVAQNYIKRLVGLPGETIAIYNGDLYVTRSLAYDPGEKDEAGQPLYPRPPRDLDLWRAPYSDQYHRRWAGGDYRYAHAQAALDLFQKSQAAGFTDPAGFQVVRKPDDLVMTMRRLVYDNDRQSKKLAQEGAPPRWARGSEAAGWAPDDEKMPKVFTHTGGQIGWIRYRHILPWGLKQPSPNDPTPRPAPLHGWPVSPLAYKEVTYQPAYITNFLGYNAGFEDRVETNLADSDQWCGDLMLECKVKVGDPAAKFVLELSRGPNRFQAEFEGGKVTLVRTGPGGGVLATAATAVTKPGEYAVRFANVDARLRVWVNDTPLDFGGKADYPPAPPETSKGGPTEANDLREPAGVGASGDVTVSGLKLYRDTHYTNANPHGPVDTYFVQPGHYLCMGDNSSQSSDGRMWGLVPERLMLGRAVFVFYPLDRLGFIR